MERYKTDSRMKSQLENERKSNILQLTISPRLKRQTRENLKLQTIQKRKLIVYRENGKFYINHFAAYTLGLTNVRSVMTEKLHLFEISREKLSILQNDERVEIEFTDLKDNKNNQVNEESDLSEALKELEKGLYGIGAHGIDTGSVEEKESKAIRIASEGLNIHNNSKTILSSSISLGTNDDVKQISQNLTEYRFGNGKKVTVVIAVPSYISNNKGERIFLGFPEENKRTAGQQYMEHCILDQVCGTMKKIPASFILGYIYEKQDGSSGFIKNANHYASINPEEQQKLYQTISQNINAFSKDINTLISEGNLTQLENIKKRMQTMNFPTYMIDNAIILTQRLKTNKNVNDNSKNPVHYERRVIIEDSQKEISNHSTCIKRKREITLNETKEEPNTPIHSTSTRRILLNNDRAATIAALYEAKRRLRIEMDPLEKCDRHKKM